MGTKGSLTKSEYLQQNTRPFIYEAFMEDIKAMLATVNINSKWDVTFYPKAVRVYKKNNSASVKIDTYRNVVHEDSKRGISKLYKHTDIDAALITAQDIFKLYFN